MIGKIVGWVVIISLVVWGIFALQSDGTPTEGGPIKIGFIGPLSGDAVSIGQNAADAVALAVDEINEAGGVDGRELKVIYEDGGCEGGVAANAFNKLVNVDKVSVILGGACSGETLAFTNTAEETQTTVLSYCSSAPSITDAGDYIFRNYPSDSFQGAFSANYLYDELGAQKVSVVYVKSDWGNGIRDVFVEEFEKLGGEVLVNEGYEQTSRDLRSQLTKVKSSDSEILYFIGYTEASIPGVKQAQELGLSLPLFGGDAWGDTTIWTEVGEAGEGAMFTTPPNSGEEFRSKLAERTGTNEVAVCTATAYDGVYVLAQVIREVGTDSTDIKDELYNTVYEDGVSSPKIEFDENGDLRDVRLEVQVVRDGKFMSLEEDQAMMEDDDDKEDDDE